MIYLFKISLIKFLSRMIVLAVVCNGIFAITVRADILENYLDLNPEVSVFSLNVGTDIETCVAATCPTYSSVELEVPEYVHTNLVTDIPIIRNGIDDVVIASIDPEIGIVKVETKNTHNDIDDELPLMDGDIIDILYVDEDGETVSSVGSANPITAIEQIEPGRQEKVESEQVNRQKLQIDKIKENSNFLDMMDK